TKLGACVGRLDESGGINVLDAVTQPTHPHQPASEGLDNIAAELRSADVDPADEHGGLQSLDLD
ncbi:MAG: hypothetical protein AAFY46_12810, partial [Planctomycetota bacterium]